MTLCGLETDCHPWPIRGRWTDFHGAVDLGGRCGPARPAAHLPAGPPRRPRHPHARPPTARSPTASGCSSWKAGSPSPPGCPPSASWPSPSPSAAPPSPPPTRRCAPRGSWSPGGERAAGPPCPPGTRCPPAAWNRCRPSPLGSMIDLGCAALPAPEPWLTRAVQGALEELPPYAHTHGDYPAGLPALRADARRPLHRARHPDHARADHGHHRCDGRHRRHLPPLRRARRAHRRRVALATPTSSS